MPKTCAGTSGALSLLLGLTVSCAAGEPAKPLRAGHSETLPRPNPAGGMAAVARNRECETCHPIIAEQWSRSLHRHAYTEPAYQRALEREPLPFCRACHAPESQDLSREPEPAIADLGVGCVTCHGQTQVLAGARERNDAEDAPHALLRSAGFSGAGACAGCHEFAFPDELLRGTTQLMQATISEQADSPEPDTSCADCHMPRGEDGRRSHDFEASRSDAWQRMALRVEASRRGARRVQVTLHPQNVGHAVPTGDLFRRLEVSAEAFGGDYVLLSSRVRYLTRHWETRQRGGTALRYLKHDDRPGRRGKQPTVVELELDDEAAGHPIGWRVAYQRVEHPRADDEGALVEGEVVLAQGVLPPQRHSTQASGAAQPPLSQ